jgi:CRP/FNR family transcriptional regulator, cyclic AMP receptor protein
MSDNVLRSSRRERLSIASRILTHLPAADRKVLSPVVARCPTVVLEAGGALPAAELPDAALLVVEAGTVVVARPAEGSRRRMVVALAREDAVLPRPDRGEEISALEPAALTALVAEAHDAFLSRPSAAVVVTHALSDAMRDSRRSLAVFGRISHTERVRDKLLQLAATHGRVVRGGVVLDLPLTHALLAEMIGSARETVSVALGELAAAGFVHRNGRVYRLAVRPEDL